jgi:hypothetical protein
VLGAHVVVELGPVGQRDDAAPGRHLDKLEAEVSVERDRAGQPGLQCLEVHL